MKYGYNVNSKRVGASSSPYIPEAIALFDVVPSFPEVAKPFYNSLIKAFVDAGVYSNANLRGIISIPSLVHEQCMFDFKTLTNLSTWRIVTTPIAAPFNKIDNGWTSKGYSIQGGNIDTGYIAGDIQNETSFCNIIVVQNQMTAKNDYQAGTYESTPSVKSTRIRLRSAAGSLHWNLKATSKTVAVATGEPGVYIANVRSNSDGEIWVNNTLKLAFSGLSGSHPATYPDLLNTWNFDGGTPSTPTNEIFPAYFKLPLGLSNSNMTIIREAVIQWQSDMEMIEGVYTKNLICDGNSHLVTRYASMFRALSLSFLCDGWDIRNFGIPGQTFTDMTANAAAKIDILYDAGKSKNILFIAEGTNEHYENGNAGLQTAATTYVTARKAAGWTAIISQIPSINAAGNFDGVSQETFDLEISTYNVWLAGGGSGADGVVMATSESFDLRSNYASDAAYATAMLALRQNATYYDADEVHQTELGYALWQDNMASVIGAA